MSHGCLPGLSGAPGAGPAIGSRTTVSPGPGGTVPYSVGHLTVGRSAVTDVWEGRSGSLRLCCLAGLPECVRCPLPDAGADPSTLETLQQLCAYAPSARSVAARASHRLPSASRLGSVRAVAHRYARRWTSQLHHFEFFTIELLVEGADVREGDGGVDAGLDAALLLLRAGDGSRLCDTLWASRADNVHAQPRSRLS